MSCWRFHHRPSLHDFHDLRTQCFEPSYFSLNIVSFNIKMNTARMVYFLNQHSDFFFPHIKMDILGQAVLIRFYRLTT